MTPPEQAARLVRELARDVPARNERVVASYRDIEGYRSIDAAAVASDVTVVARANERLFLQRLQGLPPGDADVRIVAEGAVRRLALGLGLDDVLRAYRIWAMATWTEVTAVAATLPDMSPAGMAHIAGIAIEHNEHVSGLAAEAFLTEQRGLWLADDPLRGETLASFLDGRATNDAVAALERRSLPRRRGEPLRMMLVAARPSGPEPTPRNRAVRAAIDEWRATVGADGLVAVDGHVAILVGPAGGALEAADAAAVTMVASPEVPSLAAAFAAYAELRGVLDVARRLPPQPAPLTWQDTLAAAIVSTASTHLASRLASVTTILDEYETRHRTPLIDTLDLFLADGLGPRASARRLSCHPNTVRYRLHRVRSLTGLDPYGARDSLILRLALAFRHVTASNADERVGAPD